MSGEEKTKKSKVKEQKVDKDKMQRDKSEKSEKPPKDKKDKGEKSDKPRKDKDAVSSSRPLPPPPDRASATSTSKPASKPAKTKTAPTNDYLAGYELPTSSDSDDDYERSTNAVLQNSDDEKPLAVRVTGREYKKLADKDRKLAEKAHQAKLDALREDDNVFDVAFEGQGDEQQATVSALDVKVHNLTIRAKGKILLDSTTLTITAGRRYGLVGPNGRGKSTLLRMLAKRQIPVPDNIDVLLVEQEVVGTESTALEAVVAADVELMELREEEACLMEQLQRTADAHPTLPEDGAPLLPAVASASGHDSEASHPTLAHDEAADRLNEVYERMNIIGSASAESRASKILHGLGFTEAMQKRATQSFSGGWRMRISLARALYIQPTLLLLDEPTNHLDLRAVLWLEEYLQRWKKTLVVVSHDRDFLNTITTDIIHLHDLKLHQYKGNFAQFDEMYEQKRREVNKAFEKFEKQIKSAKASGKNSKANQDKVKQDTARAAAKKTKGRGDEEASSAAVSQPQKWSDYTVEFHFPEPTELPPPLIQLMDVDFKYPGRDDFNCRGFNLGIDMGSRIAIVGPNGAGKTTLMNLLSGDLIPTSGDSRRSHKLRIGRYAQHFVDALAMDTNPVEYLLAKFPEAGLKGEQMRAKLGKFGLSGQHHLTPICKLSGGQKARVVFTSISLQNPHILLLDEPTNHLDMQSIDALCDALEEFQGGIVVISHDAQLLARLCMDDERSEVLIVEDGTLRHYNGDFDDYRQELVREINAELDEEDAQPTQPHTSTTKPTQPNALVAADKKGDKAADKKGDKKGVEKKGAGKGK